MSEQKNKEQYLFERDMDGIFDEAYFAFIERFKRDPAAAETYLRYLKDVLFLDTDQHLALFTSYNRPSKSYSDYNVENTQDTPPVPRGRLKRI